MSAGAIAAIAAVNVPWLVLIGIRSVRAFRDPDRSDADHHAGVLSTKYQEDQFRPPRDESRLL